MGDPLDREHRETLDLVVVPVVAERPFGGLLAGGDVAPERDLGIRGHDEVRAMHHDLGAFAAQQAGERVGGSNSTAARIVAGSAPMLTATGNRSPGRSAWNAR